MVALLWTTCASKRTIQFRPAPSSFGLQFSILYGTEIELLALSRVKSQQSIAPAYRQGGPTGDEIKEIWSEKRAGLMCE
jgi:hypothetical protein